MSVKETADYLNMSATWVYREAPRSGLARYKFGRGRNAKIRFKMSEVKSWVSQQRLE
ncbi:helix-turn-helix domain-containing protein [Streptomyces sp. SDT5-1]|uniref:helix-turn-helix domain-containing protein n=1 Tax=Streptomyces sp. SDT5-1 TaxID=3406418 RepID=UPI003FD02D21